jgi:hypothetical protein
MNIMKRINFYIGMVMILFVFETNNLYPQNIADPEDMLNYGANKLNDRGVTESSGFVVVGTEIIGDYDGNLQLVHTIEEKIQNDLSVTLTLYYNANVEHRVFMEQWNHSEDGYSVNAPEWIIGINGFAVQTLNLETNFHMGVENSNVTENLNGEEIPFLIPGYHFTSRLKDLGYGIAHGYYAYDFIKILMADGSKKILSNIRSLYNNNGLNTGIYVEPNKLNAGYAIVQYKSGGSGFREMWYKPGDGLTYYFEEVEVTYRTRPGLPDVQTPVMLIKEVRSSSGAHLKLAYGTMQYGRDWFERISYYPFAASDDGVWVAHIGYEVDNDYLKEIQIIPWKSNQSIYAEIYNYSSGSKLTESGKRSNNPAHTRMKQIQSIKDVAGRANTITYTPETNRKYKFYNGTQEPPPFSFTIPLHVLKELNYHSGKKSVLTYKDHSHLPSECNAPFEQIPINFADAFKGNGCSRYYSQRDMQANLMIHDRKVYNSYSGNSFLLREDFYEYEFEGNYDPYYARTKNILTTITRSNANDPSVPGTITTIKNFTRSNVWEYSDTTFENNSFPGWLDVPYRYGAMTRLIEETISSPDMTVTRTYTYDIDSVAYSNYCSKGTFELISVTESIDGNTSRETIYKYPNRLAVILNSSQNLRKMITTTKEVIGYNGLKTGSIYNNGFMTQSKTDPGAFYNTVKLNRITVGEENGSLLLSDIRYDYYGSTNSPGEGKLKSVKEYDTQVPTRYRQTEYFYNTGNSHYTGFLKRSEQDNGRTTELFYPPKNGSGYLYD